MDSILVSAGVVVTLLAIVFPYLIVKSVGVIACSDGLVIRHMIS
jgi:hypothetical protein